MTPSTESVNFLYYTTEKGIYFAKISNNNGRVLLGFNERVNNTSVEPTHARAWYFQAGVSEITCYMIKQPRKPVNHRWELIDKDDNEINLPEVISKEDSYEYHDDDDWCIGAGCAYYKYRSLYERVYDYTPEEWVQAPFEAKHLGNLSLQDVDSFQDMKIVIDHRKDRFTDWKTLNIEAKISEIAHYSELDQMLVPEFLIHNRPCSISTDQTYKIVRSYIKDNIDGRYARVTSDYNFCFTVQKVIPIKPYTVKIEEKKTNGNSYATPRFKTSVVKEKLEVIFEMCPSKRYQGYTPIEGFRGDNLKDLIGNIQRYLKELMEVINAPLVECECCSGLGVILQDAKTIRK